MKPRTIALASLGLTAIGTAIAGVQLWPRADASTTAAPTPVIAEIAAQPAVSDCSAGNISGGQVSVDCSRDVNISTAAADKTFEVISMGVDAGNIREFVAKMDAASDRIVRFQLRVDPAAGPGYALYSQDDGTSQNELNITYSERCEDGAYDCGGVEYVVNTREGGSLYWVNGGYAIDGYFIVQPVQGMHQGYVSVGLVGIPDSQARLADPAAR